MNYFSPRQVVSLLLLGAFMVNGCGSSTDNSTGDPDVPDGGHNSADAWGMMGDSGADEYRADDNRGGAYAATTLNWIELLAKYRGFNFGTWGTRAGPRRTGYEHNWARSGATSYTLISEGQHTGLAGQIRAGLVNNVMMQIGINDFSESGIYGSIYDGSLEGAALSAELDRIYENITLALQTVKDAGPDRVFWLSVQDRGVGPVYIAEFPDASKRQLVSSAIAQLNARVTQYAAAHGMIAVDFGPLSESILEQADASGNLRIGGELIDVLTPGDEPHHAILSDREHGGTVLEGLVANYAMAALRAHGVSAAAFSSAEILSHAGIGD
jgi:hypothetical protein